MVIAFDANLSDSTGRSFIRIAIGHSHRSLKKEPRPGHGFWPVPGGASILTNIICRGLLRDAGFNPGITAALRKLNFNRLNGNATIATGANHGACTGKRLKGHKV